MGATPNGVKSALSTSSLTRQAISLANRLSNPDFINLQFNQKVGVPYCRTLKIEVTRRSAATILPDYKLRQKGNSSQTTIPHELAVWQPMEGKAREMYKLSEMVYATVFWLISGLLVWLVVLPAALISLPVILLGKALGQILLKIPQQNLTEAKISLENHAEQKPTNVGESLLTSLLMTTLVGVPALLASAISLQPTRVMKREPALAPKPLPTPENSWADSEETGET